MDHARPPTNEWETAVFPKLIAMRAALDKTLRDIRSTYTGLVSNPQELIAAAREPSKFVAPLLSAIRSARDSELYESRTGAWYSDLVRTANLFQSELEALKPQVHDGHHEYFDEGTRLKERAVRDLNLVEAKGNTVTVEAHTEARKAHDTALVTAEGNIMRASQRFSIVHVQTSQICAHFEPLLKAEIAQLWSRDRTKAPK